MVVGGLVVTVALVISAGTLTALPGNALPEPQREARSTVAWPPFVAAAPPATREAYRFALENPGALEHIPCYCGCTTAGHRNNEACFIADRSGGQVVFDRHGSG